MFRFHTTRTNLLLLLCWWHIPLIFSSRTLHTNLAISSSSSSLSSSSSSSSSHLRSLTSDLATSNSQKQDGITFDDDDSSQTQPTTVLPSPTTEPISPPSSAPTQPAEIKLGAFHLIIKSNIKPSHSGNGPVLTRDDLVSSVQSIILDSLQQWNGTYSIASVEIQPVPGEHIQSSSLLPKPNKRNKVKRDNKNVNNGTKQQPQLPKQQKRQIDNRLYHTLQLQNLIIRFHKTPLPFTQTLKDRIQTAVRSSTNNGPITIQTITIYKLDLVWDGEPSPSTPSLPSPSSKPRPTDTHGRTTVPPTQTPQNTTTRIGATDTNRNPPSTTTETRLYGPLIGSGVLLLIIGLFLVRRSNRQHSHKTQRADLVATQIGAEPSMSFLNRAPLWRGFSGSTDVESIKIQDIESVVVRGGEDSYSDISSITGSYGKQQQSMEHAGECTWNMKRRPSQNVMEDDRMPPVEHLVPHSQLPRNLLCTSDVSSRSTMDDSNLLFSSGRDSDVSMSSRSAFGPDSNCWDLTGEEYEEDDGVAMAAEEVSKFGVGGGSEVGGKMLKELRRLDAKVLNRHESFLDHNLSRDGHPKDSTKRDDDLSLCDGLPSVS